MRNLYDDVYFRHGYVVFEDNTTLWWLRLLKRGFRHCYVLIKLRGGKNSWLEINPLSNQLVVSEHYSSSEEDYPVRLRRCRACRVIAVNFARAPLKCAPLGIFSCVEFVKRIVGIHCFSIFTPYQLYKKLKKSQNCRKKVLTS